MNPRQLKHSILKAKVKADKQRQLMELEYSRVSIVALFRFKANFQILCHMNIGTKYVRVKNKNISHILQNGELCSTVFEYREPV
jgi:hypothetical protein